MAEKLYYGIYGLCNQLIYGQAVSDAAAETTEATTEAAKKIGAEGNKLSKFLESSTNTDDISMYIMDILYILVVLVIALAFLTMLMYIYRYLKRRRDPYYRKNDDDFLDN